MNEKGAWDETLDKIHQENLKYRDYVISVAKENGLYNSDVQELADMLYEREINLYTPDGKHNKAVHEEWIRQIASRHVALVELRKIFHGIEWEEHVLMTPNAFECWKILERHYWINEKEKGRCETP